jgi:hypothetical protein
MTVENLRAKGMHQDHFDRRLRCGQRKTDLQGGKPGAR